MGIPNYKQGRYLMFEYADNNHRTEQDLAYHISWDWLMPVVEKINLLDDYRYTFLIASMDTQIVDNITNDVIVEVSCKHSVDELIKSVYEAVVEFIKEHNKQYPFQEGDDYWTIEKGRVVWSCWDDISEQIHDDNPNKAYYKSQRDAVKQLNKES